MIIPMLVLCILINIPFMIKGYSGSILFCGVWSAALFHAVLPYINNI